MTPISYKNWLAKNQGANNECILEFPLYSDASGFTFDITSNECPYHILNPAVIVNDNIIRKRLILRLEKYKILGLQSDLPDFKQKKEIPVDLYLEYSIADQIADILSLLLGIRVKAGSVDRVFENGDRFGIPIAHTIHREPEPLKFAKDHPVLPSALTNIYHNTEKFSLLTVKSRILSYMKLKPKESELLIRAAKLYRNALWTIESDPELSWIRLISAIETVAKEHIKLSQTPVEIFKDNEKELSDEIVKYGGKELLIKVAEKLVDKKYSGLKYRKFIIQFLPDPPQQRAPLNMQIDWASLKINSNKNPLSKIYKYRSKALHQGDIIPPDMCYAPRLITGVPYLLMEKSSSYIMQYDGSPNIVQPGPMLISIFEYIVRNVLLNWWSSCVND